MTSMLLDRRRQIRILDGVRFSSDIDATDGQAHDRLTGAGDLQPDSSCLHIDSAQLKLSRSESDKTDPQRAEPDKAQPASLLGYSYSTKVARADAYFRLWISRDSGLPVSVEVDGPQLSYRRSLSRPGKPPQAMLGPNGLRYNETLVFSFDKAQVLAAARKGRSGW